MTDKNAITAKYKKLAKSAKKASTGGKFSPPPDRLKKALESDDPEKEYVLACLFTSEKISIYAKLLGLTKRFSQELIIEPAPVDEATSDALLENAYQQIRKMAEEVSSPAGLEALAETRFREFACHFSGKLIHSDVQGANLLAPRKKSGLPHVSSSSLNAAGLEVQTDQIKNDNTGVFQALKKLYYELDLRERVGLPQEWADAIEKGVEKAMREPPPPSSQIDHRLRQLLLRKEDGSALAVSPLASGGMCQLYYEMADALNKEKAESAKDAAAIDEEPTLPEDTRKSRYIAQLEFPAGGKNPQNISIFHTAVQHPLFFEVPTKSEKAHVLRFVHKTYSIGLPPEAKNYLKSLVASTTANSSSPLQGASSLLAVRVESESLRPVVAACHARVKALSEDLEGSLFYPEIGEPVVVDEALFMREGMRALSEIDQAILSGRFTQSYAEAFASALAAALKRKLEGPYYKCFLGDGDIERIRRASMSLVEEYL